MNPYAPTEDEAKPTGCIVIRPWHVVLYSLYMICYGIAFGLLIAEFVRKVMTDFLQ